MVGQDGIGQAVVDKEEEWAEGKSDSVDVKWK